MPRSPSERLKKSPDWNDGTKTSNPRSVGFQLAALLHQIDRLQEDDEDARQNGNERPFASKALTSVRESRMADLAQRNEEGRFEALEDLVELLKATLYDLSDALTARYLTHLTVCSLTTPW